MKGMLLSGQFGGIFALAIKIRSEEPSVSMRLFRCYCYSGLNIASPLERCPCGLLSRDDVDLLPSLKRMVLSARIHASGYRPCLQAGVGQKYNICSLIWKAGDIY